VRHERHWFQKIFETRVGEWHNEPESLLKRAVVFDQRDYQRDDQKDLRPKVAADFLYLIVLYQSAPGAFCCTEVGESDAYL
jgi:hypothetical protein